MEAGKPTNEYDAHWWGGGQMEAREPPTSRRDSLVAVEGDVRGR
jgi:hypothetical protein